MRAHVLKHIFAVLVEDHDGEVLVAFHELEGIAGGCHIDSDGTDIVLPHVAHCTPADSHGVVAAHITGGQQQTVPLEPRERVEIR